MKLKLNNNLYITSIFFNTSISIDDCKDFTVKLRPNR